MDRRFVAFAAVLLWICLAAELAAQDGGGVPASLLQVNDGHYSICVDKANQRLHLYNGRTEVITLPCSTGMNPGDKMVKGDKRTPEGVYFPESMIDGDRLPEIYGWRAYVLDYPNPVDVSKGKNGNGIWIHGRNIPLDATDTKGCVSLTDADLKKISPYLYPYWTPVLTLSRLDVKPVADVDRKAHCYMEFLDKWERSWENMDSRTYRDCYSSSFYDVETMSDINEFMAYKEKLFQRYSHIDISITDLRILEADRYVLAYFLMDFSGDRYQSTGVKYLYIDKKGDQPKIINERFIPIGDALVWQPVADTLKEDREKAVRAFLAEWVTAWKSKDMRKMKGYYNQSFPELDAYFDRKERNINSYSNIDVLLEDVSIERAGVYYDIEARQIFSSDTYADRGIKKLHLVATGSGFRIISESWDRLENES